MLRVDPWVPFPRLTVREQLGTPEGIRSAARMNVEVIGDLDFDAGNLLDATQVVEEHLFYIGVV